MIRVGITMGDPAGVGPEIILSVLGFRKPDADVRFTVFGSKEVFSQRARDCNLPLSFSVKNIHPHGLVPLGEYSHQGGAEAMACIESAIQSWEAGRLDALVTGPIHKRAITEAGMPGCGHTEWLANRLGSQRPVMMLAGPRLKVLLATNHLPLRDVADELSTESLWQVIRLSHEELKKYFFPNGPTLALAALNPHGEENGEPGFEERHILIPAVEKAREHGISIDGPISADALFAKAASGQYDAVVALYHDQGLAPLKAIHFHDAVNVTLGLGLVRTSPDHGPAYDIAGKAIADTRSMEAAIEMAIRMVRVNAGGKRNGSGSVIHQD